MLYAVLCCYLFVYLCNIFKCLFSTPEILILDTERTPAPENGVNLWRRFLQCVSLVRVNVKT